MHGMKPGCCTHWCLVAPPRKLAHISTFLCAICEAPFAREELLHTQPTLSCVAFLSRMAVICEPYVGFGLLWLLFRTHERTCTLHTHRDTCVCHTLYLLASPSLLASKR